VDADRPNEAEPIPLQLEEVMRVMLEPSDYGHFGIGRAEAAWRKAGLSNAAARFAEGSFLAGGRKAHMIWPDGVSIEGEAWDQWVNGLRSVNEDGSFTRRLTANRFPIGSIETGQSMSELQVPDISKLSQQDIYAIWHMPESQVGRASPAGLNSGEKGKYEEAAFWQNAVEPRLQRYADALQNRIVDKFGLTLVLETPEFDDEAPLYDIAAKAKDVPLKVDERRALVGLDPLDEAVYGQLGQMILIANSIVELTEKQDVPEQLLPFAGSNNQTGATDNNTNELPNPGQVAGKAKLVFTDLRGRVVKSYEPKLRRSLEATLTAQADDIADKVVAKWDHIAAKPTDTDAWWSEQTEHGRLEQAIAPVITPLIDASGRRIRAGFFASTKADNFMERVQSYVASKVGARIRDINATTRHSIRTLIGKAVAAGTGPAELAQQIRELTAFNPARAELISRTETALAYNDAAIGTYRAFDVAEVQAIDGDQDEECAERDGNIYSLAEASAITDHPNGTLDWVPIVKAQLEPQTVSIPKIDLHLHQEPTVVNVPPFPEFPRIPRQEAPVVNVEAPIVNVEPNPITVNVPEPAPPVINLPAPAKATGPQEVVVTNMPERKHRVVRDAAGQVIGSVESDD
jgi:hypothetical protein